MKKEKKQKKKTRREQERETSFDSHTPPPFSVNVTTNIGKMFFDLLHTGFATDKLHKILHKNTVKLSFS